MTYIELKRLTPLSAGLLVLFLSACTLRLGSATRISHAPAPTTLPLAATAASPFGATFVPAENPIALPPGFAISVFVQGLDDPRMLAVAPDGVLYVAERGAGRILRLPDQDGDGLADAIQVVAQGLNAPSSLAFYQDGSLYVAETRRVLRLSQPDAQGIYQKQEVKVAGLPSGGHSTRTVLFSPDYSILFVAIACGAISGWHSLVSSSSTSKQLDIETDALPVGGGAMLSEGLLALASLIAYMVLAPSYFVGHTNVASWVQGAWLITQPFLGSLTYPFMTTFFGLVLVIYAITVQALVTRFFRMVAAETWGEGRFRPLGNKYAATGIGLLVPYGFAISGSWWALWLYFGGANQLLAGLAIMLITIHLARVKAPTLYSLIPGIFMVITTLAALIWETWTFFNAVLQYIAGNVKPVLGNVRAPINTAPYAVEALAVNAVFVIVGAILFLVGLSMAIKLFRSYSRSRAEAKAPEVAAADGGHLEK